MRKSFHALLIEQEKEHTYKIISVANIHDQELIGRIGMALAGYKVLELEKDFFKPVRKDNKEFPNHPDTPSYCVKVVMVMNPRNRVVQQAVCRYLNIRDENLKVTGDEPEAEDKEKSEVKDAQADVGQKRLDGFLADLAAERKSQQPEEVKVKAVTEAAVVNHGAVEAVLGRPVRRGFYVVESEVNRNTAKITGPFKKTPMNYSYAEFLNPGLKLVRESRQDDLYEFQMDTNSLEHIAEPKQGGSRKWEVEVQDNDSGRTYTVVVSAGDPVGARNAGIDTVAMREKLNPDNLIAIRPKDL